MKLQNICICGSSIPISVNVRLGVCLYIPFIHFLMQPVIASLCANSLVKW